MHYGTQMNDFNFGVKRSKIRVTVALHAGISTLWAEPYSTRCCRRRRVSDFYHFHNLQCAKLLVIDSYCPTAFVS